MNKHPLIRKIYLYIFALLGLVLMTIGGVRLVSLGLKTYVFTKADNYYEYPAARPIKSTIDEKGIEYEQPSKEETEEYNRKQRESNRQRDAAESLAMIIIGLPLYIYHWGVVKKEKNTTE